MDLDLFGAFEGDVVENDEIIADAEVEIAQPRKKSKRDQKNATAAPVATDATVITSSSVSKTLSGDTITTFTAIPADYQPADQTAVPAVPATPAKTYKFKLDPFQAEAVGYIEKGESVLVAAHTSAGKTAVAEYAIAKSLRDGQKVIYTSPIKALSNQKYRDLQEEFGDVGLMTGDMTINPNATCLIMTTEILRSMLYRGSEVMREVAWVIFDEVHYMRDKERGLVWEESIILIPHKVRFVFLSATIPNSKEFVGWVAKMHHQPCHVVYTDYRPTPLQHFVFPAGAEGLYLVVDEKGKFREENFQKAMSHLQLSSADVNMDASTGNGGGTGGKNAKKWGKKGGAKGGGNNSNSDLFKIVRLVIERELHPCIVFSFSKKDCETYALQMARLDLNTDEEKDLVEQVFLNAMDALGEDDKQLPQVQTILPLLKRGVGIHHGGLLPILKEIIEILFQEGLIKCLFATETFSIGINMPAKTVVFTATRKFDGTDFRWITSGEYIQMSGRAGRRGKDDKGIVIQMLDEKMEPDVAKGMIYGDPDPLFSSYHVSYNMVLNMLRVEDADPENLLRSSFLQYQQEKNAPELLIQAEEYQREASNIMIAEEDVVSEYFSWNKQHLKAEHELTLMMQKPEYIVPFLQPGRLMHVQSVKGDGTKDVDWGWGVLVNLIKNNKGHATSSQTSGILPEHCIGYVPPPKGSNTADALDYVVDILLSVVTAEHLSDELRAVGHPVPAENYSSITPYPKSELMVMHVAIAAIQKVSSVRLSIAADLKKESTLKKLSGTLQQVKERFQVGGSKVLSPEFFLDPVRDIGIKDASYANLVERCQELTERKSSSDKTAGFHRCDNRDARLLEYEKKVFLLESAQVMTLKAKESQSVTMKEDLKRMKRVLRRMGYITQQDVLETKGRFSCELNTGDELVLTDMVFDGVFNELNADQCVALLSCFVHKEGSSGKDKDGGKDPVLQIRGDLQGSFRQLQTMARNVAKVSIEAKIPCEEEEYVKSFNPGMIEVLYAWSTGAKFLDICKLTEIFEGSIIRTIRREEELLRQLASASFAIGNKELKVKFEEGASKIRRGVVFAASLYL